MSRCCSATCYKSLATSAAGCRCVCCLCARALRMSVCMRRGMECVRDRMCVA